MAVPTPRVSVGVTKIRRKFEAESVPITPPAPIIVQTEESCAAIAHAASPHAFGILAEKLQLAFASRLIGETGQIIGIVIQYGVSPISNRVSAENIGNPSSIISPSH